MRMSVDKKNCIPALNPYAVLILGIVSVLGVAIIGFGDYATGGKALWGDLLAVLGTI
jgi:hypothetical protein